MYIATPKIEIDAAQLHAALDHLAESLRSDLYWAQPLVDGLLLEAREVFVIASYGEQLPPKGAFSVALSHINDMRHKGDFKEATILKLGRLWLQFADYLDRRYGCDDIRQVERDHVVAWINAPLLGDEARSPANRTREQRRWSLKVFFYVLRTLDLLDSDPLVDVDPAARPTFARRPLTDVELQRSRRFAEKTTRDARSPAAFALAEATATTYEIPRVTLADLDLDNGRVWLNGSTRVFARWGTLDVWGTRHIERRLRQRGTDLDRPLIYEGAGDPASMVSSIDRLFAQVFRRAGLLPDGQINPGAVRAWAGAHLFEELGDIRQVAQRLGLTKLDAAARLINLPSLERDSAPAHRSSAPPP
jgi:integrase